MNLLIIEDEENIINGIKRAFQSYCDFVKFIEAKDASEALAKIYAESSKKPDAIILDLMMSYGSNKETRTLLDADDDPMMTDAGVQILKQLRLKEDEDNRFFEHYPLYVAIITARSEPLLHQELNRYLKGWGKIYAKPFNEDELVNDILYVFGKESKVIPELLPSGYKVPENRYGDRQ
ncbi:hypothetical protein QUF90_06810 [Desulfococcaceae bacterium HSG9]|nr:hypothetical protein [Desulfococcaceae bacterium HSG9]